MGERITEIHEPAKVEGLINCFIVKIEANSYSAALNDSGELFLWGSGVFGSYAVP